MCLTPVSAEASADARHLLKITQIRVLITVSICAGFKSLTLSQAPYLENIFCVAYGYVRWKNMKKKNLLYIIKLSIVIQIGNFEPIDRPLHANISVENMNSCFPKSSCASERKILQFEDGIMDRISHSYGRKPCGQIFSFAAIID